MYSYFGAAVIGAQWVIPDNEQAYKVSLFLTMVSPYMISPQLNLLNL